MNTEEKLKETETVAQEVYCALADKFNVEEMDNILNMVAVQNELRTGRGRKNALLQALREFEQKVIQIYSE